MPNVATLSIQVTGDSTNAESTLNSINELLNKFIGGVRRSIPVMKDATAAGDNMSAAIARLSTAYGNLSSRSEQATTKQIAAAASIKQIKTAAQEAKGSVSDLSDEMMHLAKGGQALERVGGVLTVGITAPLGLLAKNSVDAAMSMESITRGLNAVTGSAEETNRQLARLEELGRLPGLTFEQAAKASARLQAVGYSADFAEKTIKEMGNAITLSGGKAEDLDGVVRALSQIEGKGQLRAQELNQLAEHIPTIRKALKEAFGTGNTEAIQNMGLSTQETMQRIVAAFQKFPRVARGMQDDVDDMRHDWNMAMAEMGKAVFPVEKAIGGNLLHAVKDFTGWFKTLSQGQKEGVIYIAATTAALGPLMYGIGLTSRTIRDLAEGGKAIAILWPRITAFFIAGIQAKKLDFTATTSNTEAMVKEATQARITTTAINEKTEALLNNAKAATAAADANAMGGMGSATGPLRSPGTPGAPGFIGPMMPGAVGAGTGFLAGMAAWVPTVVTYAIAGIMAYGLGKLLGDTLLKNVSVPGHMSTADEERLNAQQAAAAGQSEAFARMAASRGYKLNATGGLEGFNAAGSRIKRGQPGFVDYEAKRLEEEAEQRRIETDKQLKDRYAMEDARYEAELQQLKVQAAGGETKEKHIRQEKILLGMMTQRANDLYARAEELKGRMGDDLKVQREYWDALRDADQVKERMLQIQAQAHNERLREQQEQARKAKQLVRQQHQLAAAYNENTLLQLRATAKYSGNEEDQGDMRSIAEAKVLVPGLEQQQGYIQDEMRDLVSSGKRDFDTIKDYLSLQKDYWDLEIRKQDAIKAAQNAERAIAKRAKQEQRKIDTAWKEAMIEQGMALADTGVADSERAQSELSTMKPFLLDRQRQLVEDMNSGELTTEEYYKAQKEYWTEERKIQSLTRAAVVEQKNNLHKAFDEMKEASAEQAQLMDARLRLEEAQIENNPFLNFRQRAYLSINNALKKLALKSRPVAGETELEKLNREIELQSMMGDDLRKFQETIGASFLNLRGNMMRRFKGQGQLLRLNEHMMETYDNRNIYPNQYMNPAMMRQKYMQEFYQQMQAAIAGGQKQGEVYAPFNVEKKARELAADAAMNRPVVFQIVLDQNQSSPQARQAEFMRFFNELEQRLYGPQVSGYTP